MKMKALLLGSAAALAVTGAQAADLSIEAPVDYVRVCDAFGTGYWYMPGSDTCIALDWRVRFDVNFGDDVGTKSADWEFTTSGFVSFTSQSMTEHGVLKSYVELGYSESEGTTDHTEVSIDVAYSSFGHLKVGMDDSSFNGAGQYTYSNPMSDGDAGGIKQIQLSWAMAGYGLMLGIEDPTDRWGSSDSHDVPDIVAAMTYSTGHVSGKIAAGFSDLHKGHAWGVTADAQFALSSATNVRLRGSFGSSDQSGGSAWVGGGGAK